MVLRVCLSCTALFPPGVARCPQCGADDHYEQGSEEDMAKISAAGGPTVAGVPGLDNQSDRDEDQFEPGEGGTPSVADRIELASQVDGAEDQAESAARDDQRDTEQGEDYSQLTYGGAQAEAKRRGLPATGSYDEIVARLEASDRRM